MAEEEVNLVKPDSKLLVLRCVDHPIYTGQRKPRANCPGCWALYEMKKRKEEIQDA